MLLHRIEDSGRLAEAGDWIVECETGAELIDRMETLDSSA